MALRWENVQLDARYIRITEAATTVRGFGLQVGLPKTARSVRNVDIDDRTAAVLAKHREQTIGELVFPDRQGRLMKPTTVNRHLKALSAKAGVAGISLHSLRHFHASVALQHSPNFVLVSRRLGHASVSTTLEIYGHVLAGWQRDLAETFAGALDSG